MNDNLVNFSFDEEKDKIKLVSVQEEGFQAVQYDCPKCNSSFCSLNIDNISKCVICGDTNIEKKELFLSDNLLYVPFLKNRDEVIKLYKKKVLFNPLIPIAFKKKSTISSIQKIYLPGLLTNMIQSGNVEFLGGEKREFKENKKKKVELKRFFFF